MAKSGDGNFFEDFRAGQALRHAPARTVTAADAALHRALVGARHALPASDEFARSLGLPSAPLPDTLVFNLAVGLSTPEISRNAVANIGCAEVLFGAFVHPGDTIAARSEIVGLREASSGKAGVVHARTRATNQRGETVVSFLRWSLVSKRDPAARVEAMAAPARLGDDEPGASVPAELLAVGLDLARYDAAAAGAPARWGDYAPGARLDHSDGVTIEESDHMMAARLAGSVARVHFDQHGAHATRFGRRVVFGGHVLALAHALGWNGLEGALRIVAIRHGLLTAPVFAGDTLYAWSEVLERIEIPGRDDVGALRVRTVALKNRAASGFAVRDAGGAYDRAVVLDLDHTVLMAR